jgi:hypothetical protein
VNDKADMIGQLVANVIRMFMQGKKDEDLQLEIRLVDARGQSIDIPTTPPAASPTPQENTPTSTARSHNVPDGQENKPASD